MTAGAAAGQRGATCGGGSPGDVVRAAAARPRSWLTWLGSSVRVEVGAIGLGLGSGLGWLRGWLTSKHDWGTAVSGATTSAARRPGVRSSTRQLLAMHPCAAMQNPPRGAARQASAARHPETLPQPKAVALGAACGATHPLLLRLLPLRPRARRAAAARARAASRNAPRRRTRFGSPPRRAAAAPSEPVVTAPMPVGATVARQWRRRASWRLQHSLLGHVCPSVEVQAGAATAVLVVGEVALAVVVLTVVVLPGGASSRWWSPVSGISATAVATVLVGVALTVAVVPGGASSR